MDPVTVRMTVLIRINRIPKIASMKKLELLKGKELTKKVLSSKFGALIAPEYTLTASQCTVSNNSNSWDANDSIEDKID